MFAAVAMIPKASGETSVCNFPSLSSTSEAILLAVSSSGMHIESLVGSKWAWPNASFPTSFIVRKSVTQPSVWCTPKALPSAEEVIEVAFAAMSGTVLNVARHAAS